MNNQLSWESSQDGYNDGRIMIEFNNIRVTTGYVQTPYQPAESSSSPVDRR